jgi:hypothetical protein
MIEILNKVLTNQLDPTAVMAKLDEILHRTNPNITVTTYDCEGNKRMFNPATNHLTYGQDAPGIHVQPMIDLATAGKFQDLLSYCQAVIADKPEWLTPRLFCSAAYAETGDRVKAKAMLDEFERDKGDAYDHPYCVNLASQLHQKLQ